MTTLIARKCETSGGYEAIECVFAPGGAIPPHYHATAEESLYVLDGVLTVMLGDETIVGGPGTLASIPPGQTHGFFNASAAPATILLLLWVSGARMSLETILEAVTGQTHGQFDPAVLVPIMQAHDMYPTLPERGSGRTRRRSRCGRGGCVARRRRSNAADPPRALVGVCVRSGSVRRKLAAPTADPGRVRRVGTAPTGHTLPDAMRCAFFARPHVRTGVSRASIAVR